MLALTFPAPLAGEWGRAISFGQCSGEWKRRVTSGPWHRSAAGLPAPLPLFCGDSVLRHPRREALTTLPLPRGRSEGA